MGFCTFEEQGFYQHTKLELQKSSWKKTKKITRSPLTHMTSSMSAKSYKLEITSVKSYSLCTTNEMKSPRYTHFQTAALTIEPLVSRENRHQNCLCTSTEQSVGIDCQRLKSPSVHTRRRHQFGTGNEHPNYQWVKAITRWILAITEAAKYPTALHSKIRYQDCWEPELQVHFTMLCIRVRGTF